MNNSSCIRCHIKAANVVLKRDFTAAAAWQSLFLMPTSRSRKKQLSRVAFLRHILLRRIAGETLDWKTSKQERWKLHCVHDENDLARDIKAILDPALGDDTWANYVKDFSGLGICCMQSKPGDCPAGEAVMAKLVAILLSQ